MLTVTFICPTPHIQSGEIMKTELIVDGKKIPLNKFVQDILAGGVAGMAGTLDSVDKSWKHIELKIEQDKE